MSLRRLATLVPGLCLLSVSLSGALAFDLWMERLAGLSADGVVLPHTWLVLRIMMIGLAAPGLLLLAAPIVKPHVARLHQSLMRPSRGRFVLGGLLVSVVARAAWVAAFPLRMYADWATYDDLGWRMALTGELAEATHRTMYRPPGYPFLLSLVYRLFGHAPEVAVWLNVLFGVGVVWLAYRLARRIAGEGAARWALVLLSVFPSQIAYINLTCTEPLFTLLFLGALELLLVAVQRGKAGWYLGLAAGLALGLGTLVRSLTLTYPAALAAALGPRLKQAAWPLAALVVALALAVTPWIIRNYRLNGLLTISTNGSMVFYIGNNPGASFGFNRPDPARFAGYSPAEEARIDRLAWAEGWAYIRAKPWAFLKRGLMKTAFLMTSDTEGWAWDLAREAEAARFGGHAWFALAMQAYYYVFLLGTVIGSGRALRAGLWRSMGVRVYVWTLLYWLAVHFVFFGEGRYHYPVVPIMALFAGLVPGACVDQRHRSLRAAKVNGSK